MNRENSDKNRLQDTIMKFVTRRDNHFYSIVAVFSFFILIVNFMF